MSLSFQFSELFDFAFLFLCRFVSITDKIYNIIREMGKEQRSVRTAEILDRCTSKGYTPDQVMECIEEYEELNVWQMNQGRTQVTFVQ